MATLDTKLFLMLYAKTLIDKMFVKSIILDVQVPSSFVTDFASLNNVFTTPVANYGKKHRKKYF